jgi:hypothetical protein
MEVEYEAWRYTCQHSTVDLSKLGIMESIKYCKTGSFPNILALLIIFATVPVSSASAERSFSSLKILKNYLRNRMKEERLSALALAYVHQNFSTSVEDIISEFGKSNRRFDFNIESGSK